MLSESSKVRQQKSRTTVNYGEDRIYAIGLVNGLQITLIHADRKSKQKDNEEGHSDDRRIISAWRSEPHERRRYWQSLKI
jgi:hypothetical protein